MRGLRVKELETPAERTLGYQLRYRVFAEHLRWIPPRVDRLDEDRYDAHSTSLGVFSPSAGLLGVVRLTQAPAPFMLEHEFLACLGGAHTPRKEPDTAEITRLALDPSISGWGFASTVLQSLFQGMYQWSIGRQVRYAYMVGEPRLLRVVQRLGWPFQAIAPPIALPPAKIRSVAALMDVTCSRMFINHR
jgi:N-acyl-L-homoserine lactone synthetase